MKRTCLCYFALLLFALPAFAGKEGGGGDPNESLFKDIASNIEQWLQSGNADGISLPTPLTLADYKAKMLTALGSYQVSFVSEKVIVDGVEKSCRNFADKRGKAQIICNEMLFADLANRDINATYALVHHEFASRAGIEPNNGADSDYKVSSQISAYLQTTATKRLPVLKASYGRLFQNARSYDVQENQPHATAFCKFPTGHTPEPQRHLPSARDYANYATTRGGKIRETRFPDTYWLDRNVVKEWTQNSGDGFTAIYTLNSAGKQVTAFYYDFRDYTPAKESFGEYWSSTVAQYSEPAHELVGYRFDGTNGELKKEDESKLIGPTLCIDDNF